MPMVIWYYASPWWWAWPQTLWECGKHFPVLAIKSSHCHPADSVFDTNILLSHAICPSLCMYIWLTCSNKEDRERLYRLHHRLCSTATPAPLYWLLSRNLKPRKLILSAFSDFPRKLDPTKITRLTVLNFLEKHVPQAGQDPLPQTTLDTNNPLLIPKLRE